MAKSIRAASVGETVDAVRRLERTGHVAKLPGVKLVPPDQIEEIVGARGRRCLVGEHTKERRHDRAKRRFRLGRGFSEGRGDPAQCVTAKISRELGDEIDGHCILPFSGPAHRRIAPAADRTASVAIPNTMRTRLPACPNHPPAADSASGSFTMNFAP